MPRLPAQSGTPGNRLCRGALRSGLQRTAWAGRGPHPAPRLALSFQKTAAIFRGEEKIKYYFEDLRLFNLGNNKFLMASFLVTIAPLLSHSLVL